MKHRENEVFAFLHARCYVLDGVHGRFRHTGEWPYERLMHEASDLGKTTPRYREVRARLKDEWTADLSGDLERCSDIALRLGYRRVDTFATASTVTEF